MNGSVLVICPRGGAGELFADVMAKKLVKFNSDSRVGFSYPYLPDYAEDNPALLQQVSAVVRDGMISGVAEFLFTDTNVVPVLEQIPEMLPEGANPVIYNPIDEARAYFGDPQERPLWLDRWKVSEKITGFDSLFSLDRQDLKKLTEEVIFRTRGVTGGVTENAPAEYKDDITDEEGLRTRSVQLLLKLEEMGCKNGILLGNADLAVALTRYIDEEYRGHMENCHFVHLAEILAVRIL